MRACLQPRAATAQKTVSASVVAVMSSFRSPLLKFYMHSYTFMRIRTRMYTCICSRLTSCNITYIQTDIQKTHTKVNTHAQTHTQTHKHAHMHDTQAYTLYLLWHLHMHRQRRPHTHTHRQTRTRTHTTPQCGSPTPICMYREVGEVISLPRLPFFCSGGTKGRQPWIWIPRSGDLGFNIPDGHNGYLTASVQHTICMSALSWL